MTVPGRVRARIHLVLLGAVVLAALLLRFRGVDWPDLHPDEPTIARWSAWMEGHDYVAERFYAGGFFQLSNLVVLVRNALCDAAQRWQEFMGANEPDAATAMRRILFLRVFNVWLGVSTVALFYWLAWRVTGRRAAALAAALFLAFSNVHVEHVHYAETDIAMLFSLTLALGCWARCAAGASGLAGYLLASFLTGWAVGTKFTLGLLLLSIPVGAWAVIRSGRRTAGRTTGVVLAGLFAGIVGIVYTNQGILHVHWFRTQVASSLAAVYGERGGLLSQSAHSPWAALLSNWDTWCDGLAELGVGWTILAAAGFLIAFFKPCRRFWPVTILFPLAYLTYFFFLAPWTRGQEFMSLYPAFAVWCALAVAWLAAVLERWNRPMLAGLALLAVVGAATAESGIRALRIVSLFGVPDPRVQALEWLQMHAPLDASAGIEGYTYPIGRVFPQAKYIWQVERTPWHALESLNLAYVARNPLSQGRGSVDPRTRRLYPQYERMLQKFTRLSRRLCTWGPVTAERYTFAGQPIEWWSLRQIHAQAALRSPIFRPVCLRQDRINSVPGTDSGLGSVAGIWVDRTPRQFVVNGPPETFRPLFIVLQTAERSAVVSIDGLGSSHRISLAPYDAAAVPLQRTWWKPPLSAYDVIRVAAAPEPFIGLIPCYAQIAATPAEAACLLFQKGYPDKALVLLESQDAVDAATAWLAYGCAVAVENWPAAARWQTAALRTLEQFEALSSMPPAAVAINGVGGIDLQAHRRMRLPPFHYVDANHVLQNAPQVLTLEKDDENRHTPKPEPYETRLPLPVRLAKGEYRIRLTIENASSPTISNAAWRLDVRDTLGGKQEWELNPDSRQPFEYILSAEDESDVELVFSSAHKGTFQVTELEIRWGEEDLLQAERRELYRARAVHLLHETTEAGPARAWIKKALAAFPDDKVLQRLEKDAGREPAAEPRSATPAYVFYPWLRLVAATEQREGARTLWFDVLRDHPPPLTVKAFAGRRGPAGAYFETPLADRPLVRGEHVCVTVPAPPDGSMRDVALRVESAPCWEPRPLRIVGRTEPTLKLAEIIDASSSRTR